MSEKIRAEMHVVLAEHLGEVPEGQAAAKNLQEALGCTSLDTVSIQIACEERFGIVFAEGTKTRGPIDEEWDALKSVEELIAFVVKHNPTQR